MNRPPDHRLDELFVRYWDQALTSAEARELEQRLADSPEAREWFKLFCLQAVVAAERPAIAGRVSDPATGAAPVRPARGWSRRRVLAYLGGAAAAGVVTSLLSRRFSPERKAVAVRLAAARGTVTLLTASGTPASLPGLIPAGATVSTYGPGSAAVLRYPDGTDVSLTGDSTATVTDDGRRLLIRQGTATATVPSQPAEANPLTLATREAALTNLSGVVMTLGCILQGTELGVHQGRVKVATPTGEPLEVVREGEILTVRADGDHHKQPLPITPDKFAWDLTRPLPDDWHIGQRVLTPEGPVLRPEFWFDPYHQAEMSQIRSDKQWSRGFFRLYPESVIRVRYWVDQAGPSQMCFCVRTNRPAEPMTGMLEYNGAFARARPGQWQWLEVKAGDMLDNIHTPKFGPPWVGFLIIFNTYKVDLGLKIAEFRVRPPAQRPAGL